MDTKSFYGSKHKSIKTTTIEETVDVINLLESSIVTILPPESGDQNIPSDEEDYEQQNDLGIFEPAGTMEVEYASSSDEEDVSQPVSIRDTPKWKKNNTFTKLIEPKDMPLTLDEKFPELINKSCYEIWKLFFTEEMLIYLVEQTELYAHRDKNDNNFKTSKEIIAQFIGIIIFSGYHFVTSEKDYWSNQPDLRVSFVADIMSRDTFFKIKKYFHVADNLNLEKGNKVAKVSLLYRLLNERLSKWGVFHKQLSIDESMVPYYGKHSAKMYIKGKPIRFGYKIWSLCGYDGYPYKMTIYTGKDATRRTEEPLGHQVVLDLLNVVDDKSFPQCHEIYFDNFFTSQKLLEKLADKEFISVGTIRENRTGGATARMKSNKVIKKEGRGSFDYRSNGNVFICKWNDNSIVNIGSNFYTHEPVNKTKRWVKGKGKVDVTQPHLIKLYNEGMGGVDLMDRLCGSYRPMIRSKKWWWPLMINVINVSLVAAWKFYSTLHKDDKKSISHLDFRREVVLVLTKSGDSRTTNRGGKHADLPAEVKYDGTGHETTSCTQGRCVVCFKNTRHQCKKCNVRLHYSKGTKCFINYHKE